MRFEESYKCILIECERNEGMQHLIQFYIHCAQHMAFISLFKLFFHNLVRLRCERERN